MTNKDVQIINKTNSQSEDSEFKHTPMNMNPIFLKNHLEKFTKTNSFEG